MILFDKKDKESNKDYVYRVLKENIMSMELKPGELISEIDLSEKMGISRTPIREVLTRLKGEHLIEVKPQSGTFVSLIDLGLVEEAKFMRFALEEKVLKKACENFNKECLVELEKNLYAQQIIAEMKSGKKEFYKLDNNFHELFFEGVNMDRVWKSILSISTHYDRIRILFQIENYKMKSVDQHREMLKIIKNKEVDKVKEVLVNHFNYGINNWENMIEKDSELYNYIKKDSFIQK